jgi:hypothetical protein
MTDLVSASPYAPFQFEDNKTQGKVAIAHYWQKVSNREEALALMENLKKANEFDQKRIERLESQLEKRAENRGVKKKKHVAEAKARIEQRDKRLRGLTRFLTGQGANDETSG